MPPRDTIFKHYARIIQRWPQDNIRQSTVKESLKRRITQTAATEKVNGASPEKQINALYSLLENRYSSKVSVVQQLILQRIIKNGEMISNFELVVVSYFRKSFTPYFESAILYKLD